MCLAYIPKGRRKFTSINQELQKAASTKSNLWRPRKLVGKKKVSKQLTLEECLGVTPQDLADPSGGTILATGDPLIDKPKGVL